jgi:hypothetical protein
MDYRTDAGGGISHEASGLLLTKIANGDPEPEEKQR